MKVTRFLCRNSYTVVYPTTPSTASTSLSQAAASASPLPRWIATATDDIRWTLISSGDQGEPYSRAVHAMSLMTS